MSLSEVIQAIGGLLGFAAAALAWLAKLRWSAEFARAKDETIRVKDERIAFLESHLAAVSPPTLLEHAKATRELVETAAAEKEAALKREITKREQEIESANEESAGKSERLAKLESEKAQLELEVRRLSARAQVLDDLDRLVNSTAPKSDVIVWSGDHYQVFEAKMKAPESEEDERRFREFRLRLEEFDRDADRRAQPPKRSRRRSTP